MMLCGCVVGQKGWTKGGRGKDGRGGGREEGGGNGLCEADRSLAKVFIAVLAGCLLPGGGTFWLKDIEGKKSPPGGKRRSRVGWEGEGGVEGRVMNGH